MSQGVSADKPLSHNKNFVKIITADEPVSTEVLRSVFPSWIDSDVKEKIEQLFNMTALKKEHAHSPLPRPSSHLYSKLAQQLATEKGLNNNNRRPSSVAAMTHHSPPIRQSPPAKSLHHNKTTIKTKVTRSTAFPSPQNKPTTLNKFQTLPQSDKTDDLLSAALDKLKQFSRGSSVVGSDLNNDNPAATSASNENNLRYALLLQKLDELSSLHRQVLQAEAERVNSRQITLSTQQRLEQAEKMRLQIQQQYESEKQTAFEMYESMKTMYEQLLKEKESSYQQSLRELLLREKQHHEFQQQASTKEREALQLAQDERERLQREHAAVRADLLRTIELLQQEKCNLQQSLSHSRNEVELLQKQVVNLKEDNLKLSLKVKQLSEENKSLDELQTKLQHLSRQLREREEDDERRVREWKEERLELERREERIKQRMKELDEREDRRRHLIKEKRLFEMRMKEKYAYFDQQQQHDSAWASGPLDRYNLY